MSQMETRVESVAVSDQPAAFGLPGNFGPFGLLAVTSVCDTPERFSLIVDRDYAGMAHTVLSSDFAGCCVPESALIAIRQGWPSDWEPSDWEDTAAWRNCVTGGAL